MVDLFAGPGGLDVAAHWLGLRVTGIEWDANACETRESAKLTTESADVRDCKPTDYPGARILTGGPPCQTYTVAGSGRGRQALKRVKELVHVLASGGDIGSSLSEFGDDHRTGLVLQPLKWALECCDRDEPYEAIVLEQVTTVLPVWEEMAWVLRERGYQVDCGILQTERFGVPQTRRRAILIARLGDRPVELPKPTHQLYRKGVRPHSDHPRPWVSMGEALGTTKPFTVVSNYGTGGDPKARGTRESTEPAATVTGKVSRNRVVWHDARRTEGRVTPKQAGIFQTFPHDYPWSGKDIAQQIGNAIPPRLSAHVLAAALGRTLNDAVLDECVRQPWSETRNGVPDLLNPEA